MSGRVTALKENEEDTEDTEDTENDDDDGEEEDEEEDVEEEVVEPKTPVYAPESPLFIDIAEDAQNRVKKKFRCPFKREGDRMSCNKQDDSKCEMQNHFYKYHFARICPVTVFEENLNCFYTTCQETFSTHEKLIKHIHKHEGGKESMFFVKYLIDNLEKEEKDEKLELSMAYKAEKIELLKLLDSSKQENQNLAENHAVFLQEKMKESNEREKTLAELRGKLSIQVENYEELKSKNEQLAKKYPNNENWVQKYNRLEKKVELAKKQIKAKDAELRKKNDEIFKLTFAGSDDESSNPDIKAQAQGEYLESD